MITEVVTCASILAICIPNLKPFLDSLESGQIRIDDLRRQGKSSSGYASYNRNMSSGRGGSQGGRSNHSSSRTTPGASQQNSRRDPLASKASQRSKMFEMVDMPKTKKEKEQQSSQPPLSATREADVAWDGQSHTSQTILIQQTKTWYVDVEERRSSD